VNLFPKVPHFFEFLPVLADFPVDRGSPITHKSFLPFGWVSWQLPEVNGQVDQFYTSFNSVNFTCL
jgi:hypothetical protein